MGTFRGRGRAIAPKRQMFWSEGPRTFNPSIQSVGSASKFAWNLGQSSGGGITIVRIRGAVDVWLEVATTVGDAFGDVAFGIGVVSGDAFAAGAASMPGPLSDPDWDWMWVHYLGAVVSLTTVESALEGLAATRIEIDTKAMRKLKPNQTVFGVLETEDETGAVTLSFSAFTRMLSKLG